MRQAKVSKPKPGFTVIRDTREKEGHGWSFPAEYPCQGTLVSGLKTGDYSLLGCSPHESDPNCKKTFVIERKGSVVEFVQNISQQEKWADFKAELERLEEFSHPFAILEFHLEDLLTFPVNSTLPRYLWKKVKVKPPFLMKRFLEIECRYKTKFLFAGKRGWDVALSLFKRVNENVVKEN